MTAGWCNCSATTIFNQDRATEGLSHANKTLIKNLRAVEIVMPVAVDKIRPGVMVKHQVQRAGRTAQLMNLRVATNRPTRPTGPGDRRETSCPVIS